MGEFRRFSDSLRKFETVSESFGEFGRVGIVLTKFARVFESLGEFGRVWESFDQVWDCC